MTLELHTLTITHKHGDDTTVHLTEEDLQDTLVDHVDRWWGDWDIPERPGDDDEAIQAYFDEAGEKCGVEFYETSHTKLDGLPDAKTLAYALRLAAANLAADQDDQLDDEGAFAHTVEEHDLMEAAEALETE